MKTRETPTAPKGAVSEAPPADDWTMKPGTTITNSSDEFQRMAAVVEVVIRGRDAANHLLSGNANMTARLILAELAHQHNMVPQPVTIETVGDDGVLHGRLKWNGHTYRLVATPTSS